MLSQAILQLQESGTLHVLKERWWKKRHIVKKCLKEEASASKGTSALGLANVGGVFVVLLTGSCIACVTAVFEFIWRSRKALPEERVSSTTTRILRAFMAEDNALKGTLPISAPSVYG